MADATNITDRQKLDLSISQTVEFRFGSVCDEVKRLVAAGVIPANTGDSLMRFVRNQGNAINNVVSNHLDYYVITRNHRKDKPNIERAAHTASKG